MDWIKIKGILDCVITPIYPYRCPYCDKVTGKAVKACSDCAPELTHIHIHRYANGGFPCESLFPYKGAYADGVKYFKFNGRCCYCKPFGIALSEFLLSLDCTEFDIITCVPMHPSAKAERGYNQSELLAKECAERLSIPYMEVIAKVKKNKPQHTLIHKKDKINNVKNVYRVIDKELVKGKRILVIDDVITTGSTIGECCRILQKYAKELHCATICSTQLS